MLHSEPIKKWPHCEISLNSFHKHPYGVTATCMFVGLSRFPKKTLKRGYIYKWEILHRLKIIFKITAGNNVGLGKA